MESYKFYVTQPYILINLFHQIFVLNAEMIVIFLKMLSKHTQKNIQLFDKSCYVTYDNFISGDN